MRELDEGLEENAEHVLAEIDAALRRIDDGHLRNLHALWAARSRRSVSRPFRTRRSASTTSARSRAARERARDDPSRRWSTSASARPRTRSSPVSSAERSLAAGTAQWIVLDRSSPVAAVVADQLTKQVVGRTLALGESVDIVGPFSIHHVQNSGIAFGLFASRTAIVDRRHGGRGRAMLVFFARSGRRHPMLPVALGPRARREHREPHRPCSARACHRLPRPRRLAGVQPRGHVHRRRRRDPLRRARARRPARTGCTARAVATLRFAVADADAGTRLDRALASRAEIGSRSLAERLLEDGAVTVDGTLVPEEPPARAGIGGRSRACRTRPRPRAGARHRGGRVRGRAPPRRRQAGGDRDAPRGRTTRRARSRGSS